MLARDLSDLPDEQQRQAWEAPIWAVEPKLNGVRFLAFVGDSETRFSTRVKSKQTGLFTERTDNLPHLRDLPLGFLAGTVLDGELVLDKEKAFTGTTWAQGTLACTMAAVNSGPEHAVEFQEREGWAKFFAFDLLRDRGQDVTACPQWERRARLKAILGEMASRGVDLRHLALVPQLTVAKHAYFLDVLAKGGEGVMLKRLDGRYRPGARSSDWLKAKKALTLDGFISGATAGQRGHSGLIGSLLVSVLDQIGQVREVAGVAPYDLSLGARSNLRRVVTLQTASGPALHPEFCGRVVELGAFCWNKNRRLVHAKILRFRDDKTREDCVVDFNCLRVG